MVNRQRFAMWLGLVIVLGHVFISLYLWTYFNFGRDDGVFIKEVSLPVTLGYSIAIVKWFLDNHGIVTSDKKMGIPLVILITIVSLSFLGGLIVGPVVFASNQSLTADQLNDFYLLIESAFGALFSLIFSYLFSEEKGSTDEPENASASN